MFSMVNFKHHKFPDHIMQRFASDQGLLKQEYVNKFRHMYMH